MISNTLKETFYCDYNHPGIRDLAVRLSTDAKDPVEVAKNIFCHVRDEIPFGFDLYRLKASETLERGYGVC